MDFRAILETLPCHISLVIFGICLSLDSQVLVNWSAHGNPASISRSRAVPSPTAGPLELAAESLESQAININQSAKCLPVHVANDSGVDIQMLHCSAKALAEQSLPLQVTDDLRASAEIARRVHFWRRIYSLWGSDQWVLHLAEWPEVQLEVYDASRLTHLSSAGRVATAKKVSKSRRKSYAKLLRNIDRKLNQQKQDTVLLTMAELRIVRLMSHIEQPNKYLIAARNIRLQRGQRDFIETGLSTSQKYMPHVEKEFTTFGIPTEIAKLAFVESSFNLAARSKVGASGVFQIMPATGRQYLTVKPHIDERNDPVKAGRAAAKLLRLNYRIVGSWPLAITAYNHGVGGMRRAVKATKSTDLATIINNYNGRTFGFASKNFYASFLGILTTLGSKQRLFPKVPKIDPMSYQQIRLPSALNIHQVYKRYNINSHVLKALNPDLSKQFIKNNGELPQGFRLKLPIKAATERNVLTL